MAVMITESAKNISKAWLKDKDRIFVFLLLWPFYSTVTNKITIFFFVLLSYLLHDFEALVNVLVKLAVIIDH